MRIRVSPEKPLTAAVFAPTTIQVPPKWPLLSKAMVLLLRAVPTYRATRNGARGKRTIQIAIGVLALVVALAGKTWPFALCGAVLASLSLVLPVPATRRSVWENGWKRRGEPVVQAAWAVGDLVWDGTKLTVRVGDRVVKSVRPAEAGYVATVLADGGVLELVRKTGGNPKDRWIFRQVESVDATPGKVQLTLFPETGAIGITRAGWDVLAATLAKSPDKVAVK